MKKFWIQFSLFLMFSLVMPISFICFRFKLFSTTKQLNTITVWAVLALIILITVVSLLIKIYLDGMKTKYSFLKQILQGLIRVIFPLGVILIVCIFARKILMTDTKAMLTAVNNLIQTLIVCISCEAIAIVINPLPKWSFDNNVEGLAEMYDKIKGGEGKE